MEEALRLHFDDSDDERDYYYFHLYEQEQGDLTESETDSEEDEESPFFNCDCIKHRQKDVIRRKGRIIFAKEGSQPKSIFGALCTYKLDVHFGFGPVIGVIFEAVCKDQSMASCAAVLFRRMDQASQFFLSRFVQILEANRQYHYREGSLGKLSATYKTREEAMAASQLDEDIMFGPKLEDMLHKQLKNAIAIFAVQAGIVQIEKSQRATWKQKREMLHALVWQKAVDWFELCDCMDCSKVLVRTMGEKPTWVSMYKRSIGILKLFGYLYLDDQVDAHMVDSYMNDLCILVCESLDLTHDRTLLKHQKCGAIWINNLVNALFTLVEIVWPKLELSRQERISGLLISLIGCKDTRVSQDSKRRATQLQQSYEKVTKQLWQEEEQRKLEGKQKQKRLIKQLKKATKFIDNLFSPTRIGNPKTLQEAKDRFLDNWEKHTVRLSKRLEEVTVEISASKHKCIKKYEAMKRCKKELIAACAIVRKCADYAKEDVTEDTLLIPPSGALVTLEPLLARADDAVGRLDELVNGVDTAMGALSKAFEAGDIFECKDELDLVVSLYDSSLLVDSLMPQVSLSKSVIEKLMSASFGKAIALVDKLPRAYTALATQIRLLDKAVQKMEDLPTVLGNAKNKFEELKVDDSKTAKKKKKLLKRQVENISKRVSVVESCGFYLKMLEGLLKDSQESARLTEAKDLMQTLACFEFDETEAGLIKADRQQLRQLQQRKQSDEKHDEDDIEYSSNGCQADGMGHVVNDDIGEAPTKSDVYDDERKSSAVANKIEKEELKRQLKSGQAFSSLGLKVDDIFDESLFDDEDVDPEGHDEVAAFAARLGSFGGTISQEKKIKISLPAGVFKNN
jgi:hypothetical protein